MGLKVTFKKGEVGRTLDFALTDANGAVDLTNWTVTMAVARSKNASPVLTGQSVTKRTQSGLTLGQCFHTLDATSANIAVGEYKACELKLVNGPNVLHWPVNENDDKTYFTIEVQKPIS